jgi:hypothetical protein
VLDASNNKTGTTANPTSGSRIISANSRDIVVQSSPSLTGAWSYEWTAPANPTGSVTVYAAGLAANGTGSDNGDQGAVGNKVLTLDASSSTRNEEIIRLSAFPNPCSDYLQLSRNVDKLMVTGINGVKYPVTITNQSVKVQDLPAGFYYVNWVSGTATGTLKFQKI